MKRLDSKFYDEEYFIGSSKSNYGKLNPKGGYTRDLYLRFKMEQIGDVLSFAGYTTRWRPKNALVAGCAVGYLVEAFQIDGKTEARGIDISEYAINRGTKEGIKNLLVGDICDMPYKDKEFEMVVALEVVEHIPMGEGQLFKMIDELVRVCSGYIVIGTPVGEDDENPKQLEGDKSHFSVHTPNWWATEFERRGVTTFHQVEAQGNAVIVFEVKNES